jgi:CHAT domain-containing protein
MLLSILRLVIVSLPLCTFPLLGQATNTVRDQILGEQVRAQINRLEEARSRREQWEEAQRRAEDRRIRQQEREESFRRLFWDPGKVDLDPRQVALWNRLRMKTIEYTALASPLREIANNKLGEASTHATVARRYLAHGDSAMALKHFRLAEVSDDPSLRAEILRGRAAAYFMGGEMKNAIESYGEARSLMKAAGNAIREAEVLTSLAWIWTFIGEPQRAFKEYDEALALLSNQSNREIQSRIHLGKALIYHSLGKYQDALIHLKRAHSVRENEDVQAEISMVFGEVLQAQRRFDEAIDFLDHARKDFKEKGQKEGEAAALAALARIYRLIASEDVALRYYNQARQLMQETGNISAEAGIVASIGEVYFWSTMRELRTGLTFGDPRSKVFPKALSYYNEALEKMQRDGGSKAGQIGILTNIAVLFDVWDKPKKAIEYYTRVIQLMEELRTSARILEFKTSVAEQSVDVYERAILTHIRMKQPRQAFELSERARARSFLDQLGSERLNSHKSSVSPFVSTQQRLINRISALERQLQYEIAKEGPVQKADVISSLESHLATARNEYADLLIRWKTANPDQGAILSVDPLTLEQTQQYLDRDTTLISYFVTRSTTLAFVITRDSFQTVNLPMDEGRLSLAVSLFQPFPNLNEPPLALNSLYTSLVRPFRSQLKTSTIVIAPHRALHGVPFAALIDDGKNYLGDSFKITYLPSASALPFLRRQNVGGEHTLLAMAPGPITGWAPLPSSMTAVEAISHMLPTTLLTGGTATKSALRDNVACHSILHLTTHYVTDDIDPVFSHLALSPEGDDAGSLNLQDVCALDLHSIRMVVLDACRTQIGVQTRGDEIAALSRAFLAAGAPSVVASLWSVDDAATSLLMTSFYSHLRAGVEKAEALRRAQRETRTKYPHPYFWASFVLMGDRGHTGTQSVRAFGSLN